jgi:hypothetical protein
VRRPQVRIEAEADFLSKIAKMPDITLVERQEKLQARRVMGR